jgi:lipoprotein-releasing system permease protein
LLTRYLALACIISVMLGVATLIVVNSVMSGFSTKLRHRLHGLLSDVLVEAVTIDGFGDADFKMQRIRESAIGDKIEAMTPTLEILGILQVRYRGQTIPRFVRLIGIDPDGRAKIGGFAEHLVNPDNKRLPSFALTPEAEARHALLYPPLRLPQVVHPAPALGEPPPPDPVTPTTSRQPAGAFVGYAIAHFRDPEATVGDPNKDVPVLQPGDEVVITTISGQRLAPVYESVVVADFFKSEMSEYDSNYVFLPLGDLQRLRTMEGRVTSIQIKLKDYDRDARDVVKVLEQMFPPAHGYKVETWEDKQGPLLAAIAVEKGILNVLLFLIICVAGFGILAIFSMIVVEKTRDIGILKALGASNGGVMKIFLGYGLLLGVVGACFGTVLGLTLTVNINEVERLLGRATGQELFPRNVYYFDEIPTHIQAWAVVLVNVGALAIAVVFSILPALRAAMLHPVRALRYE